MKQIIRILSGVILAAHLQAQTNVDEVKLAIISESPEAADAADMLTVEFTKNKQVHLLERAEIGRVYREQGLSAANTDYLKLGRVLGADGLLILHLTKESGCPILSLRWVAVRPGVTLRQRTYPWPLKDLTQWTSIVVSQLHPLLSKFLVLPKDAVPISVLNLRSAVASVQGETLERELTQLLYDRLINERNIFLLERRRLDLLSEENQLNNARENTFWNGSYLIEGVIDKMGYQKGTVTIEARLTPPDKMHIRMVDVSGPRTNLSEVVNHLATKILAMLPRNGGSPEWNPQAEAERYFQESQWMFRWGMFQEAMSAGEAAWALGKQNREVAQLRIKAYQASAGDPGICVVLNDEERVFFGLQINPNVLDFGQIGGYASAPRPEQFADMIRAAELFQSAFSSYATKDKRLDPEWLNLGETILNQTSLWLRYYYFTVEARSGQEDKIEDAKLLCLGICKMMENYPGFASADNNHSLLKVKARNAAFWVNTPEQCLPIYRDILKSGQWPFVRRRFLNAAFVEKSPEEGGEEVSDGMGRFDYSNPQGPSANLANPCLAGWTWADRQRCPSVWNSFIDELCSSSQPSTGLEGRILRCSYSWSDMDFEQQLGRLNDYVRQQHETILAAGLGNSLLDDLHFLVSQRALTLTKACRHRIQDQVWPAFDQQFAIWLKQLEQARTQIEENRKQQAEIQQRQAEFQKKKDYLNSQTNFDFMSFAQVLLNEDYRPDEAGELLPLLTNYLARISNSMPVGDENSFAARRRKMEQQQAVHWVSSLEKTLLKVIRLPALQPTSTATIQAAGPPPHSPHATLAKATPVSALSDTSPAPPSIRPLNAGRFWKIPDLAGVEKTELPGGRYAYIYNGNDYIPQIVSCCYRDGKLWVEVRYDRSWHKGRADFFSIDLATFAAQKIEFEGDEFSLPNQKIHSFEPYKGYLYLSLHNAVSRYSFKNHSWKQFPVPASGGIMPVRLKDRLFFTSSSSILEYTTNGSFRTLASSRRRPPMTLLDKVENYGSPHLFLTKDNQLHARVGDGIYVFSSKNDDWFKVDSLPRVDNSNYYPFDEGFIAANGWSVGQWSGLFGDLSSVKNLFRKSRPPGSMLSGYQLAKLVPTEWSMDFPSIEFCLQGNSIWFLTNPPKLNSNASQQLQVEAVHGIEPCLVCFTLGEKPATTIPVRFDAENINLTPGASQMLSNPLGNSMSASWEPKWLLDWTPPGLVLIREALPGFWFIPAKKLAAGIERVYSQRRLEANAENEMREKWRTELLSAYDRNHNGRFEASEREAAVDNLHYLKLKLPVIDINSNNLLEASELNFLDENTNGVLDPQEQQAMETTISILADNLITKLTSKTDGRFDPANLPPELFHSVNNSLLHGIYWDNSGNPANIRENLVKALQSNLEQGLNVHDKPFPWVMRPRMHVDAQDLFKMRVERYWQFCMSHTNPSAPAAFSPP
jgi:hypothetical protein